MSAPQFTPGRWYVNQAFGSDLFRVMHDERGQGWHRVTRLDADKAGAFTRSDAHLIAAAPDLYEALDEAICLIPHGQRTALNRFGAILAKARGEQVQS